MMGPWVSARPIGLELMPEPVKEFAQTGREVLIKLLPVGSRDPLKPEGYRRRD